MVCWPLLYRDKPDWHSSHNPFPKDWLLLTRSDRHPLRVFYNKKTSKSERLNCTLIMESSGQFSTHLECTKWWITDWCTPRRKMPSKLAKYCTSPLTNAAAKQSTCHEVCIKQSRWRRWRSFFKCWEGLCQGMAGRRNIQFLVEEAGDERGGGESLWKEGSAG